MVEPIPNKDEKTIIFHCDVNAQEVTRYSFPDVSPDELELFVLMTRDLGIYESLIYYTRRTLKNTIEDMDAFVFGHLKKKNRKHKLDSCDVDGELDVSLKHKRSNEFRFYLALSDFALRI